MRPHFDYHQLDPCQLTPEQRLREIAAILASGLRRLRDRTALGAVTASNNLVNSAENPLELLPPNPLTVHVG